MADLRLTYLLGAISIGCFTVLVVTGGLLMTWFDASSEPVAYDGSYAPMRGVEVSEAYASVLHISFDVRAGLVIRQAHHWAALLLPASLMLQLTATYFHGGFRRPRRAAWVLLCTAFLAALGAGWSGYGLPDDQLSGTGLRIFEGILRGLPVVGSYASFVVFGGEFPGRIIENLYPLHVVVFPVLAAISLGLRGLLLRRTPDHVRTGAVRERPVPVAVARLVALGIGFLATGWIVLMAGLFAVNPVWRYGPASGSRASAGSQPDWYTGFLDGALRLAPSNWDAMIAGWTVPLGVLVPQAVAGGLVAAIFLWPFLEPRLVRSGSTPETSDRPRDHPTRTAFGVAGLTLFTTLLVAGASDWIAIQLHIAFEIQVYVLRVAVLAGPFAAFVVAKLVCRGLVAHECEVRAHGAGPHALVRDPAGGYADVPVSGTEDRTGTGDDDGTVARRHVG
ncbi:ubiquinol-cytochrome c reductase cytochrome b subunit [Nocardioides exalbidus]|uniref:Cytochrome bc1 complex cytochrome b subunit n=1 Tax=Nocardioides exalbidus TaxID=402596 RepID=A0A1H4YB11_9ACTN|nr:cytochrome b N-terminal domain-containing protein [Nocardioides exalbidus]SED15196.1 ubiquinol-cytochrome c reductase cytochrome b subunit [Nocardioides exalbidus]